MIINPDIILEKNYLQICLQKMFENPTLGSIGGKIYRYDFEKKQKTKYIDTIGLFCFRNRRVIDDGQGMLDQGQFEKSQETFGLSGACPIYRRAALEEIKIPLPASQQIPGENFEYWDNDFFMYKEDVDLAWRLRLFGWKAWYEASAIAYHGRGTGILTKFTHLEVAKNRRKLNYLQKYHSYKNQRLMQLKNEFLFSVLKNFFPIFIKEILAFSYILFLEPRLLKSFIHYVRLLPKMLKKRKYIMAHRKITWRQMEPWLNNTLSNKLNNKQSNKLEVN